MGCGGVRTFRNSVTIPIPYSVSFHTLAHSFAIFCTFLHLKKTQVFSFHGITHSSTKNRGWRTPLHIRHGTRFDNQELSGGRWEPVTNHESSVTSSGIIYLGPMRPDRIPLFPLNVVLLPGAELPLHIFEPRYREMVKNCLEGKSEFGMLLSFHKGVARVGCTAQILDVVRHYHDGRMDILTAGRA